MEVDFSQFSRFLISLKFVIPDDLHAYEKTLVDIDDIRQKIARAFYILDFYTQPISNFDEEFNQDVPFLSYNNWIQSMCRHSLAIDSASLWNEREIESDFVKSGIIIFAHQREIPKNHIILVCSK